MIKNKLFIFQVVLVAMLLLHNEASSQALPANTDWIRPDNAKDPAVWGIRNGIVFSLWPYGIETAAEEMGGGPRGLIRVGYEFRGNIYHINFIAVEPIVNGKIEFSEISPSQVDGKWGKLMWVSEKEEPGAFYPAAISRGNITHPDPKKPELEELSLYIFMEQFMHGAHPYLKVSIRNDRPEEIALEIFNHKNSAVMERCGLTATMGNYARVRKLYLKGQTIDARELYKGYDGIDFIEKEVYPVEQLLTDKNGDFIVMAATNEPFSELSSWPQDSKYLNRSNWRYRPYFKVTQYWRKEKNQYDPSLQVRVNGRAKYWSGGSRNKNDYIDIPGGPSFENFELREKYYAGQKFYFGITRKEPHEMGLKLSEAH